MKTIEQIAYHYLVTRYTDGRIWYEGYADERVAREYADKCNDWDVACGQKESHTEYVGTILPADVVAYAHDKDLELMEDDFSMQPLTGSEKQIAWARGIRYRYAKVLIERHELDGAIKHYHQKKYVERNQASWWIDNRHALGITTQESAYIAAGYQNGRA